MTMSFFLPPFFSFVPESVSAWGIAVTLMVSSLLPRSAHGP